MSHNPCAHVNEAREWNPRFVCYARAHNQTPAGMLDLDEQRWPGGKMVGFITWINRRWREWEAKTGRHGPHGTQDNVDFDAWLKAKTS